MIRIWVLLLLLTTSLRAAETKDAGAATNEKAAPFAVRMGCPNILKKLQTGQAVTVVFLGGSITENRGSFAFTIPPWLREQYPAAKIESVNAGWGGTGSALGAQRIDREVLVHHPDLLFVEFAVNDMATPGFADMERIVRKTWTANPETDIVFLYTISQTDLDFYKKGVFPPNIVEHEKAAAHYGIPMIAIGESVAAKVLAGTLAWADFSNDTCHPHLRGYIHYTEAMAAALPAIFAAGQPGPHSMPEPMVANFVLRPPAAVAVPQPPAAPLRTEDGRSAEQVFEMPRLGDEWVGSPEFAVDGQVRWRLYWQPLASPKILDATAGLDRSRWQKNLEWIDEPRIFTGPSLRRLAGGVPGEFGSNATEMAVAVFVAPKSGEYVAEFGAQSMAGFSQHEKQLGLNLVHFPGGATEGKSAGFLSSSRVDMKPFVRRGIVRMQAGDELALVFIPFNVGGGAYFDGVTFRCGRLR